MQAWQYFVTDIKLQLVYLGNGEGPFAKHAKKLSSVCVDFTEEEGYMTRTTTIVLVDRNNNVKFVEQNHDKNKLRTVLDLRIENWGNNKLDPEFWLRAGVHELLILYT